QKRTRPRRTPRRARCRRGLGSAPAARGGCSGPTAYLSGSTRCPSIRLVRVKLFNGFTRRQVLARQSGIAPTIPIGAKQRAPARRSELTVAALLGPGRSVATSRGIDVFPNDFFFGGHFQQRAITPRTDKGVAVGKPLSAGQEHGIKVGLLRGGVTPDYLARRV